MRVRRGGVVAAVGSRAGWRAAEIVGSRRRTRGRLDRHGCHRTRVHEATDEVALESRRCTQVNGRLPGVPGDETVEIAAHPATNET